MNLKIDELRDKANRLVEKSGVYLMKDSSGKIIYIGKAKVLKNRVVSYFRSNRSHNEKVLKMVSLVDDFDYIVTNSEFEALVLECSLIKQYRPKYNILLKDDKGYHYIKITNEAYPRISIARQKLDDKSQYLGPFVSSFAASQSVEEVTKLFMLPTCSKNFPQDFKKARPCLNYHIKKCMGVCKGNIKQEDYLEIFAQAVDYLKNGSETSIENLTAQMQKLSDNLEFEKAAKLRDKINAIKKFSLNQKVIFSSSKDQDFVAIELLDNTAIIIILKYRNGTLMDKVTYPFYDVYDKEELLHDFLLQYYQQADLIPSQVFLNLQIDDMDLIANYFSQTKGKKTTLSVPQKSDIKRSIDMAQNNALEELSRILNKKSREVVALQELQQLLGLSSPPKYIESYDISNLKDSYIVGGMVVFKNALPFKRAYKKFSMKENLTQDDFSSMREMLHRRFSRYINPDEKDEGFKTLPDLILLDGGSSHVSSVSPILREFNLNIPVFGMVKDSRHRTRAIALDGGEIQISTFKSAFRLITQIQDEVHRFSITFQKQKHKSKTFAMELTSIPKIGEKKALALLKAFKTKKELKNASISDLQKIAKCDETTANLLHDFIKSM